MSKDLVAVCRKYGNNHITSEEDKAIQTGLNSDQYFAFASGYLVKVSVVQKQLADDEAKRQAEAAARAAATSIPASTSGGDSSTTYQPYTSGGDALGGAHEVREDGASTTQPAMPKNRRFFMSADLDTTRINRDVQKYVEEIIQHLTTVDGARVKVSLEVEAETDEGFTQQTVRTISENCRTLRVRDSGFEE